MVTTNSPFVADTETASVDEKSQSQNQSQSHNLRTIETTHYIMEKPSQNSLASATVIASASTSTSKTNEKNARLSLGEEAVPRASDLSTPSSVHHQNPFDTDVEAMITHTTSEATNTTNGNGQGRRSIACRGLGDSQVWPGQSHWKKKAKEQKARRSCSWLSRLSKRNRLICKVLIVLLVVGIAVGVGLGISKPLGAPIWGQKNS